MREGFVGVHIGAGQHSEARTQVYLAICAEACRVGVEVLKKGGSALEAACSATMVLENAGETNAGYGSNLTESGTVEMDAGIMDGTSLLFGAVGKSLISTISEGKSLKISSRNTSQPFQSFLTFAWTTVVSISLFWFCCMPFSYNGYFNL